MTDEFTWTTCIVCGVKFAMPTALFNHQHQVGGYHHCPNGHSQGWPADGSENARLRRERDRLKQEQARLEDENRAAWATANAQTDQRRKVEAELKRVRKRATAALCPCCNRSFSQLARHMKSKHPEVAQLPARKEMAG